MRETVFRCARFVTPRRRLCQAPSSQETYWRSQISEIVCLLRLPRYGTRALTTTPSTVTIKDIARVAGVAPSTVSKALNGSDAVSETTRANVAAVATRLGYCPNSIARSLKVRRTHTPSV
jgi:transcriptional regulator with XRE-family HTH domain